MNLQLSITRVSSLASIILLCGCGVPKEVTAWPGMEVAEFNRLNERSAQPMTLSGSDWIGIDSPVTLVFRQGEKDIRFKGSRTGGGIQVASSDLAVWGAQPGKARINTIAFNLDGGMEDIRAKQALLTEKCGQLARIAGLPQKPVPDPVTLRERLKVAKGSMVEVCGGSGPAITFQIAATHYDKHWRHGADYGWAYFDGYLGLPLAIEGEQAGASSAGDRAD